MSDTFETTFRNTDDDAKFAVMATVNAASAAGDTVTVNGRRVQGWDAARVAKDWSNGSVSFDVARKDGRNGGTVWVKRGETAEVRCVRAGVVVDA